MTSIFGTVETLSRQQKLTDKIIINLITEVISVDYIYINESCTGNVKNKVVPVLN
jgi:hypothetical protein